MPGFEELGFKIDGEELVEAVGGGVDEIDLGFLATGADLGDVDGFLVGGGHGGSAVEVEEDFIVDGGWYAFGEVEGEVFADGVMGAHVADGFRHDGRDGFGGGPLHVGGYFDGRVTGQLLAGGEEGDSCNCGDASD